MNNSDHIKNYKLLLFSLAVALLTYGFALTNFTLTIDNETPIYSDFGLEFGRWGQNLILYELFDGHLQYFTLLISLLLYSFTGVRLAKIFNLESISAYFFCALFVTFPQISYQVVFAMMAYIAPIGILLSVFSIEFFLKGLESKEIKKKWFNFLLATLVITFLLSIYQAFILVPPTIYALLILQNTFKDNFNLKTEIKNILLLILLVIISVILYIISVKIICPPMDSNGYLSSFASNGNGSNNHLLDFCLLWGDNLIGNFYYGERTFIITTVSSIALIIGFVLNKKLIFIRTAAILVILLLPFFTSFFITSGYNPPRLYVTSNIVYAFLIVYAINYFKIFEYTFTRITVILICTVNFYYITKLFYSSNEIYKHDLRIAEKIDGIILSKYPNFPLTEKKVYFYGYFPYEYHNHLRLKNSEIFGGSFYSWDNGNNFRIINFFSVADVADYSILNTREELDKVKDSIATMPAWPSSNSIKMIDDIVVVKLGESKGMPMYFE
ncbi:glucosyltransferase domain-containing protein [Flavobacterium sp. PLA-1-15]|uniref:glucosyltransferase domain-containing protein n=1 Tax=Flavobacterium sp. PLA-1-15 TaxID=3380533 RepID=UPI003B789AC8